MLQNMVNSEAIQSGSEPEDVARPSLADSSADQSPPSDPNHTVKDVSDQLENVGLDGGSEKREEAVVVYPVRADAEDCVYYMKHGSCKFGSTCKFNHPLARIAKDKEKVREKEGDCKYFFRTGGCKHGDNCKFNHTNPNTSSQSQASLQPKLNLRGFPLRPGETECQFYMRNGSCKFGADCKFDHPEPVTVRGTDSSPSIRGNNNNSRPIRSFSPNQASSSSRNNTPTQLNGGATSFVPAMMSQPRGVPSQTTPEWNSYQAPLFSYHTDMSSRFSQFQFQFLTPAEEFPDRPDQPECGYYLKTGDCKFKFNCRYHHPKNRLPKHPPYSLNDMGLPIRPGEESCTHYTQYGICKFGPACKFDHSLRPSYSTGVTHQGKGKGKGKEIGGWN